MLVDSAIRQSDISTDRNTLTQDVYFSINLIYVVVPQLWFLHYSLRANIVHFTTVLLLLCRFVHLYRLNYPSAS